MIHPRRAPKRRPQHARPCVLAPTRTVAAIGGFGILAVAVVAGCAAVTSGQGSAPPGRGGPPGPDRDPRPARVRAVRLPAGAAAFVHDAATSAILAATGSSTTRPAVVP